MLDELPCAGFAIDTRQDSRVCCAIDDEIGGRKGIDVGLISDVASVEFDLKLFFNQLSIQLGASPAEVVDTDEIPVRVVLANLASEGRSYETADACEEEAHSGKLEMLKAEILKGGPSAWLRRAGETRKN